MRQFRNQLSALGGNGGGIAPIPPDADYWYSSPGYSSDSGMRVSPETAMKHPTVYACVRVVAETFASMPAIIYKRLPDGGKERATDHPLYDVLHNTPNQWQTAFEFFEMMQGHLELRGNAFAAICPGKKGAVDSLVPIHPDRVAVFRLPNGRLRYQVRAWYDGSIQNYAQDEMFHMRGLSSDGMVGMSTIALQREPIGTALAQQEYAARFFANDSKPGGVLEHPAKMSPEAYKRAKESFQESQQAHNRHKVALLEEGMKYTAISVSNKDSQFLEARQFSRGEVCGMFRVPPHKIGDLTKAAFSNIEQQAIEFITDCMRPRVVRWESRISQDLIVPLQLPDEEEYFIEFLMDALLRGDLKSRYDSYTLGRNGGWLCPNDVCRFENLNPIPPEKGGDDYLRPLNYMVAGAEPPPAPPGGPGAPAPPAGNPDADPTTDGADPVDPSIGQEDESAADARAKQEVIAARLREFVVAAGGRVVRKEVTALRKALARSGSNKTAFVVEATEFYEAHKHTVAETMHLEPAIAASYTEGNLKILSEAIEPIAVLDWIETDGPDVLATLSLGAKK
jgi:HK97 family phage portal protein